jgi:hypothetical protein
MESHSDEHQEKRGAAGEEEVNRAKEIAATGVGEIHATGFGGAPAQCKGEELVEETEEENAKGSSHELR